MRKVVSIRRQAVICANCSVYFSLVTVGLGDKIAFTIAAVLPLPHTKAFPHIHPTAYS